MRIRFDKIDGFIIFPDDKIEHLTLFDYGMLDKICEKVEYLISKKWYYNSITHNFERIRVDSYNSLHIKNFDFS